MTNLFGNAVALGPDCKSLRIENCILMGHKIEEMIVSTDEAGRISDLKTSDPVLAAHTPATIHLRPIWSEEKRKQFPVPKSLGGAAVDPLTPENLADMAIRYLEA